MLFKFKNLGAIKDAKIEMGNLTIISGKNNTGKTYLTYAIWGVLSRKLTYATINSNFFDAIDKVTLASELNAGLTKEVDLKILKDNFKAEFSDRILQYGKQMNKIFDSNEKTFEETSIEGSISDEEFYEGLDSIYGEVKGSEGFVFSYENIKNTSFFKFQVEKQTKEIFDKDSLEKCLDFIAYHIFNQNLFILTAQRDALHLFKNAINKKARYTIRNGSNDLDKYALPLESQIDFVSDLNKLSKYDSFLKDTILINEIEKILGVKYQIHYDSFQIQDANGVITPAFMASTSVRTLADLHFYLKHIVQKGDLLMIDEPELNLHPENQIKIARLLVKLVNSGIKVWITTHSDYIVKELNNCFMLSNDFAEKEELMQEYGYTEKDILKKDDIRVYIAHEEGTVEEVKIDKLGMEKTTFDEAIKRFNEVSDSLFDILG
ncbi:MAG: hypothetical protein EAZ85_00145 [Bacteroidetes bacterium]|nr:MAG: hypothetical protein EAZ85_00145 [Bacteroidota bacterium]TAG90563.1 MAG: hypothetical protein EAZ20_04050 [Bacteroidota bacterium]